MEIDIEHLASALGLETGAAAYIIYLWNAAKKKRDSLKKELKEANEELRKVREEKLLLKVRLSHLDPKNNRSTDVS